MFYLTHPQVRIDPAIAVPEWELSEVGATRVEQKASDPWTVHIAKIVSSAERKAIETARIMARPSSLEVEVRPLMHENDRSSTGFLQPAQFEIMRQAFFGSPDRSIRGWERAVDAQSRIVGETRAVLVALHSPGDVLLCGHGAVGTLLLCHLAKVPISVEMDQPAGGGNVFCFDRAGGTLLHRWRTLEDLRIGEPE